MKPESSSITVVQEVRLLFEARGSAWYGGEAVSQLEHALQTASLAEGERAGPALITAALLHDVGHLLDEIPENAADQGIDDRHEFLATAWLGHRFGPEVVEPVGMHVAAKRYLCAVDADYAVQLSQASRQSLRLQGGAMTGDEVTQFEARPFFADSVRLRRWDDQAKVVGLPTPHLDHFLSYFPRISQAASP